MDGTATATKFLAAHLIRIPVVDSREIAYYNPKGVVNRRKPIDNLTSRSEIANGARALMGLFDLETGRHQKDGW
jgi:hypothetical protein